MAFSFDTTPHLKKIQTLRRNKQILKNSLSEEDKQKLEKEEKKKVEIY